MNHDNLDRIANCRQPDANPQDWDLQPPSTYGTNQVEQVKNMQRQAKKLCTGCPLLQECTQYALDQLSDSENWNGVIIAGLPIIKCGPKLNTLHFVAELLKTSQTKGLAAAYKLQADAVQQNINRNLDQLARARKIEMSRRANRRIPRPGGKTRPPRTTNPRTHHTPTHP